MVLAENSQVLGSLLRFHARFSWFQVSRQRPLLLLASQHLRWEGLMKSLRAYLHCKRGNDL